MGGGVFLLIFYRRLAPGQKAAAVGSRGLLPQTGLLPGFVWSHAEASEDQASLKASHSSKLPVAIMARSPWFSIENGWETKHLIDILCVLWMRAKKRVYLF